MAAPPAELVSRYVAQHRDAQGRLLDVVAGRLALELGRLPDLSDDARDAYVAAAVPLVAAGQRRSATLAAGLARAIAPKRDEGPPLELALDDVTVTAETAWLTSPIIVARRELGDGASWAAAIALAASKARGYTAGDLAVASRHGLELGARSSGARVRGYRKVLAGGACAWCRDVSSGVYGSASSVPFHAHDACSVAPVFDD